jgi:hypothetical protein
MAKSINIKFTVLLTIIIILGNNNLAKASNFISDSLVENLNCDALSSTNIYASIRPEAFSSTKHIPIHNWSFNNGPYALGVCWSLSHSQRLFFYLSQLGEENPADSIAILNLMRGTVPTKGSHTNIRESKLKHFYTFKINSFSTESGLFADLVNGIWDPLIGILPSPMSINTEELYSQRIENGKLFRNISSEVERYQTWRFHQFDNSKMATDKVPRPRNINQDLAKKLTSDIDKRQLPLVNIKPNLISQHIVLIKAYERNNESIKFFVYDSNIPKTDNYFIYDLKSQEFKAPEVIRRFPGISNPDQDVSVYLVDEDDHAKIANALLNYYTKQCN